MNATHLFDENGVDFIGKYSPIIHGNPYTLPIMDQLTGFVIAVPILDKTS